MLRKTRRRMLAIGCRSSQFNRHRPVVSDQRLGHRSDLKVSNDELIVLITRGHVTERDLFLLAEPLVNAIENFKLREEVRSEEHTSELQSLMRNSYAVFCLKKKKKISELTKNHDKQQWKRNT